jgi:putrescine aminotransferase
MTTRNIETARAEAAWINRIVDGTTTLTDDLRREIATKTVDNFRHHVNKGFLEHRKSATIAGEFAMTEWSGKGSILTDTLGREFIDALGGFGLFSLGVAHPKVVAAVKAQLDRNPQYSQEMLDPLRAQLCRVIANLTPGNVQCGFIANSGTEGVEGAIKLAKLHTGRSGFISMTGGFHGKTAGSLSLLGKAMFRQPLLPLLPDIRFAEFGNLASVEAELRKAEMVGEGIAGIVAEPIQGEAGAIVPPDDFWPGLRRLCDRYGTLLIADEVQTGFGRTGTIFGVDHWNVAPDIMCFGKALGGGVVACSAFFATPEVWECMTPNPFMHTTTTGGNPIACAAALAGIEVMFEEDTPRLAREKGDRLTGILEGFKAKYPSVLKDVRGKGLLIGLSFADGDVGYKAAAGLFQRRVLTSGTLNNAKAIRIEPALNTPDPILDEMMNRLEDVLKELSL